jgi:hypothetical protein
VAAERTCLRTNYLINALREDLSGFTAKAALSGSRLS